MIKNIAVVGLGLIGASFAKAVKKNTNNKVFGYDIDTTVVDKAIEQNAIDDKLSDLSSCDIVVICLYPDDVIEFIKNNISLFKKGAIITDFSGVKSYIHENVADICHENSLYYIGAHPMAGNEKSGYDNSYAELFSSATMILCKDDYVNVVALKALELLSLEAGFSRVTISDAKTHDKIIAFTSQLAHVVSNAYVKSENASLQDGFSAGSYKDLTRVADLNVNMWTQLFFHNKENLIAEIESVANNLLMYAKSLRNDDQELMKTLLSDGVSKKRKVG